jgi:uncharacterized protein YutE (UPF0331/DUF86 family)
MLAAARILDLGLADRLQKMVGFRNITIREFDS